ncbi:MAG: phospholipid carrier-dependent glycosyltransferase [Chloroflexota bacterium]
MDLAIVKKIVGLSRKEYPWIIVLTLIVLAMHFSIIAYPNTIILDEVYYVNDAQQILSGNGVLRGEHPPLAILLVYAGTLVFGDNSLGWRFSSVILGSASIFLLYLVCRQLAMSRRSSFLASFLLALENLTFIQSSVAMLDASTVFFMLLAFWLYLKENYPMASIAGAFSVLCKLTGVFTFLVIGLHWLITRRNRRPYFILSMLLAPLLFIALLPLFDFVTTDKLISPIKRIVDMFTLTGSITFETAKHPNASHPWEWLVLLKIMPYAYNPDYLAVISPTVWALIIPTVGYLVYRIKKGSKAALFAILWFASTYLVWLLLDPVTERVTYVFYMYPTIGSICIGLGMALSGLFGIWQNKTRGKLRIAVISGFFLYLALHTATFILLSPVFGRWIPPLRYRLFG